MRKQLSACIAVAATAALMLGSCQTSSTSLKQSTSQTATNVLQDLLGGLLNNAITLNEKAIQGTWNYVSPECRFESENALSQAGGSAAAASVEQKIEEYFNKFGIKSGACSFTFNTDNSCTVNVGGRAMSGTYVLNGSSNDITITTGMGLVRLSGKIYLTTQGLAILFDANKILQLAQMLSLASGDNTAALAALLGQYNGMLVGFNLKK